MGGHMDYKVMHKGKVIALANENDISGIIDKSLCPACFAIGGIVKKCAVEENPKSEIDRYQAA